MPLFEFVCDSCGVHKDFLFPSHKAMEESDSLPCDQPNLCCGTYTRVPSAPAVHFSGGGWTPKHYTK